jgi:hypothetical protein
MRMDWRAWTQRTGERPSGAQARTTGMLGDGREGGLMAQSCGKKRSEHETMQGFGEFGANGHNPAWIRCPSIIARAFTYNPALWMATTSRHGRSDGRPFVPGSGKRHPEPAPSSVRPWGRLTN